MKLVSLRVVQSKHRLSNVIQSNIMKKIVFSGFDWLSVGFIGFKRF